MQASRHLHICSHIYQLFCFTLSTHWNQALLAVMRIRPRSRKWCLYLFSSNKPDKHLVSPASCFRLSNRCKLLRCFIWTAGNPKLYHNTQKASQHKLLQACPISGTAAAVQALDSLKEPADIVTSTLERQENIAPAGQSNVLLTVQIF